MPPITRPWLLALALSGLALGPSASRAATLDFRGESATRGWFSVDDSVMGGVSHSHFERSEGGASFHGRMSLDNNGGFASVRSPALEGRFGGTRSLTIKVRGDGRRYDLCLKKTSSWDGVMYRASFDTVDGEWLEVEVPLAALRPTWRGRLVERAGPIIGAEIAQLGFMIADKRPGDFALEIAWVDGR